MDKLGISSLGAILGMAGLSSHAPKIKGSVEMITDKGKEDSEGIVSVKVIFDLQFEVSRQMPEPNGVEQLRSDLDKIASNAREGWNQRFAEDVAKNGDPSEEFRTQDSDDKQEAPELF